jgi:hypothetical protein
MVLLMCVALIFGAAPIAQAATTKDETTPPPVSLGDNTYSLTRGSGFIAFRGTEGLAYRAREDAVAFCAGMGKKMKEISIKQDKASLLHGGFSKATVVFKALDANDPELTGVAAPAGGGASPSSRSWTNAAPAGPASATGAMANPAGDNDDLRKLEELRAKGVLSDREFKKAKKRLEKLSQ